MIERKRPYLIQQTGNWIVRFGAANPAARSRLFCFPFAGGDVIDFRDWCNDCPDDVELFAVQLPGRGLRFQERPVTNMEVLVKSLGMAILSQIDRPYIFFGHSLGGRIAFALAEWIKKFRAPAPSLLAVSASLAPGARAPNVSNLSDSAFCLYLEGLGGISREALINRELMDLVIPRVRADFILHDSLAPDPVLLDCPILACGGHDDSDVTETDLDRWRYVTSGPFARRMFPGGHFYLQKERAELMSVLFHQLRFVATE